MSAIIIVALAAVSAGLFLGLRLYPIWRVRMRGCDAYNILLCAEYIRRERRLPPRIPDLFILEEPEQWYPPVFLALAALFPENWLRQRFWLLNQLIDLVNALLIFAVSAWMGAPVIGFAAVLVYAIVAGLVQEFAVLNTRPLGLLVVNLLLLTGFMASQDVRWVPAVLVCGVVLVYSHKLSAQQLWFSGPVVAVTTQDWRWLALVPAIYLAAFAIWPRGFRKIIAGHAAIVRFWHRHWPLLGAHAVKQSPIYGDGHTRADFYMRWEGWQLVRFAKEAIHQNYFVVPALLGIAFAPARGPFLMCLGGWITSVYLAAVAIHFVRAMRGIGLGRQYVKFALVPSLLATAMCLHADPSVWLWGVAATATLLAVRQYWLVARLLRAESSTTSMRTPDLDVLLAILANDSAARIMVLPVQLCDIVAYATRRPVYWGTHAQIFDERLEAFFPVLRRPLSHYVEDGRLTRLLLDTRYATPSELGLKGGDVMTVSGHYVLVDLTAPDIADRASPQKVMP